MSWLGRRQHSDQEDDPQAINYSRIFTQKMGQLYWLAYVLTGDLAKAEECYVDGLDHCLCSNPVFEEWKEAWSRRSIIKNAIRIMSPAPCPKDEWRTRIVESDVRGDWPTGALLNLDPFARFLFVMSVLERYPTQECAVMLGCCPREALEAKIEALRQIGTAAQLNESIRITFEMQAN